MTRHRAGSLTPRQREALGQAVADGSGGWLLCSKDLDVLRQLEAKGCVAGIKMRMGGRAAGWMCRVTERGGEILSHR